MAALEILQAEDGIEDTDRFAVLFQDEATLKATNETTCLLTRVTVWHSCDSPSKIKGVFSKKVFTFSWIRVRTSFQALSPSSIKHLLPSGVKLVLTRTSVFAHQRTV